MSEDTSGSVRFFDGKKVPDFRPDGPADVERVGNHLLVTYFEMEQVILDGDLHVRRRPICRITVAIADLMESRKRAAKAIGAPMIESLALMPSDGLRN